MEQQTNFDYSSSSSDESDFSSSSQESPGPQQTHQSHQSHQAPQAPQVQPVYQAHPVYQTHQAHQTHQMYQTYQAVQTPQTPLTATIQQQQPAIVGWSQNPVSPQTYQLVPVDHRSFTSYPPVFSQQQHQQQQQQQQQQQVQPQLQQQQPTTLVAVPVAVMGRPPSLGQLGEVHQQHQQQPPPVGHVAGQQPMVPMSPAQPVLAAPMGPVRQVSVGLFQTSSNGDSFYTPGYQPTSFSPIPFQGPLMTATPVPMTPGPIQNAPNVVLAPQQSVQLPTGDSSTDVRPAPAHVPRAHPRSPSLVRSRRPAPLKLRASASLENYGSLRVPRRRTVVEPPTTPVMSDREYDAGDSCYSTSSLASDCVWPPLSFDVRRPAKAEETAEAAAKETKEKKEKKEGKKAKEAAKAAPASAKTTEKAQESHTLSNVGQLLPSPTPADRRRKHGLAHKKAHVNLQARRKPTSNNDVNYMAEQSSSSDEWYTSDEPKVPVPVSRRRRRGDLGEHHGFTRVCHKNKHGNSEACNLCGFYECNTCKLQVSQPEKHQCMPAVDASSQAHI